MLVKRELTSQDIESLLGNYSLGVLNGFAAVRSRMASTIFHLNTEKGHYVLALYEDDMLQDIHFLIRIKKYFSAEGIPCASPIADKNGQCIQTMNGQDCILWAYLPGHTIELANGEQIKSIGNTLGRLHTLGTHFTEKRPNLWGSSWRSTSIEPMLESLPIEDALLLQEEMGYASRQNFEALPKGTIHGHLCLENVLFEENNISGVVDFYYGCYENLLLDLALTANTCCLDGEGKLDQIMVDLLLTGYQRHRTLTKLEHRAWPGIRQVAALHAWLLSLNHYYFPAKSKLTPPQNPDDAKNILIQLRNYDNVIKAE